MKRKREKESINYLDMLPRKNPLHHWTVNPQGQVTLEVENRGVFHKAAQKLFGRPRISYVHLDRMGSFIWPRIDGIRNIGEIAGLVEQEFGEEAHPLYPRIAKYFQILESYGFVTLETGKTNE